MSRVTVNALVLLIGLAAAGCGPRADKMPAAVATATSPTPTSRSADGPGAVVRIVLDKLAPAGARNAEVDAERATFNDEPYPDGYRSRATFDLPGLRTSGPGGIGRGGIVEVFATTAEADRRRFQLGPAFAFGNEAHHQSGRVLVRINPQSSAAAKVGEIVAALGPV